LTRSLRRHLGDSLNLRLEGQLWRRPSVNEASLLDISTSCRCLERRVTLLDHDEPVVLAHSLMPGASLVGSNRRLAWLGTRPLGEVLFADPSVHRQILEMARLEPQQSVFPGLDEPAWARRSVFQVRRRPLLVYEAFLPRLFEPDPAPALVQRNAA
jgi:chorismate--pyruvate lyase